MKQLTSLILLVGAAALAAAQSPPPSTGTDSSHANAPPAAPASSPASSTAPPATTARAGSSKDTAPSAATTPSSADKKVEFKAPKGYRRLVRNGEERFCRNELVSGSRAQRQEVCLTPAQLQAEQRGSQDFIQNVQRSSGTAMYSTPMGAGGMGR